MFSYILHMEGGGTSCHIWTGLAPLFHLVLMVVSLEDISRLLWVSQDGATSRGVSLCSQWNMFLIGEIVISLIHLQFSQSFQWMWANKTQSGCGHDVMTCWFEWGKYLSCSVVMAFIVICHHVSKYTKPWGHWKLWQWLSVLISLTHFEVLQLLHSQKITPAWSPFLADLKLTLRASPRGRTSPTLLSTPHHRRRWTCFGNTPTPPGQTSLLPGFSWNNDICK